MQEYNICKTAEYANQMSVKGEKEEDILKNGAEHATQAHAMNADDIYVNRIPANFLCQTIPKLVDE